MSMKVAMAYVECQDGRWLAHVLLPHAVTPEPYWLIRPEEVHTLFANKYFFVSVLRCKTVYARRVIFDREVQRRQRVREEAYRQWAQNYPILAKYA